MRTLRVAALLVPVTLIVLAQSAAAQIGGSVPAPRFDTSYVVLLEGNPDYRPATDSVMQATLQSHIAYQLRLIAEKKTIMGGPMVPSTDSRIVGMTVLRAASLDEARRIAREDPGVAAGLFNATVRVWTTARAGS